MRTHRFLVWLLGYTSLACGDSDGSASAACAPVAACGGDLVGSWRVDEFCLNQAEVEEALEAELPPQCSNLFQSAEGSPIDLTFEFAAAGTWTSSGSVETHLEYRFDEACLAVVAPGFPGFTAASCTMMGEATRAQLSMDMIMGEVSCALSDGVCACDLTTSAPADGSGTYTLDGNQLLVDGEASPYCVSGDRFEFGDPVFGRTAAQRN